MPLTRRALLSMLALAALDPERLLWRPGRKLILIPRSPEHHRAFYSLLARILDTGVLTAVRGLGYARVQRIEGVDRLVWGPAKVDCGEICGIGTPTPDGGFVKLATFKMSRELFSGESLHLPRYV